MDKQARQELDARTVKLKSHEYQKETIEQAQTALSNLYAKEHQAGKFTEHAPRLTIIKIFTDRVEGLKDMVSRDGSNQAKILDKWK